MAKEKICEYCKRVDARLWINGKHSCKICSHIIKCTSSQNFLSRIKKYGLWYDFLDLYPDAEVEYFGEFSMDKKYIAEVVNFSKEKYGR